MFIGRCEKWWVFLDGSDVFEYVLGSDEENDINVCIRKGMF